MALGAPTDTQVLATALMLRTMTWCPSNPNFGAGARDDRNSDVRARQRRAGAKWRTHRALGALTRVVWRPPPLAAENICTPRRVTVVTANASANQVGRGAQAESAWLGGGAPGTVRHEASAHNQHHD